MSDMKLIMENWRGYVNALDSSLQQVELECDATKSDTIYLIKENKIKETSFSLLMEKYDRNEISTEKLGKILEESIKYEHQKLLDEGVLDSLKKSWAEWKEDAPPEELGKIAKAQWRARQVLYTFTYGAAAKAVRFVRGVISKIVNSVGNYIKTLFPLTKNPPKKPVAIKLLRQALKLAKYVGKILRGVAKALGAIVKPVIKFLSNPVVKNAILIACVAVLMVSAMLPGALIAAPAFLIPMAQSRVAVATAKKAIGLEEQEESLDEDITGGLGAEALGRAFTMGEFAVEVYESMSLDELGKAIDILANEIGDATVDHRMLQSTVQSVVVSPDGTEVINFSEKDWFTTSDQLLFQQFEAMEELQQLAAHKKYEKVLTITERGMDGSFDAMNNIVRNTIVAAKLHCEDDPASCAGASKFIEEVDVMITSAVESEATAMYEETRKVVEMSDGVAGIPQDDEYSSTEFTSTSSDSSVRRGISRPGSVKSYADIGQPDLQPGQVGTKGHTYTTSQQIRTKS